MLKWIKQNWKKSLFFMTIGYFAHLFIEAFLVTNALALIGITIPIFV